MRLRHLTAFVPATLCVPALKGPGTLHVGAPTDVSILGLRQDLFDCVDNDGVKRTGPQRLFPRAAIIGGRRS